MSLRRLDWRFLLPDPGPGGFEHLVLLGGPAGLEERAKELGVARRVSRRLPAGRVADAVVGLAGTPVPVEAAARALRPGGVLYWEVDRRDRRYLGASPTRVRRRIRTAGLTPTGTYWAKPNHAECSMYLPLEADGCLAWYFDTTFSARTPLRRLARSALRRVTGWQGKRFGALAPTYSVTACAADRPAPPIALLGHADLPACARAPGVRPLLLLSGEGEWSRVVLLPFGRGERRPDAVVKFPRDSMFNAETEHERRVVERIRDGLDPALRDSLPRPLAAFSWRELSVVVESYARGSSLFSRGAGREWSGPAVDDLRLAARWLTDFHAGTVQARPRPSDAALGERLLGPIEAYVGTFGETGAEARLFDGVRRRLESLHDVPLPLVWHHRDFGPWNVYRDGAAVTVLDWEVAELGPPLCDLLYFAMHWLWMVRARPDERARQGDVRALFLAGVPVDHLIEAVHAELERYTERLGIHDAWFPVLLVHTLVEQALAQRDRMLESGRQSATRSDNRYIGYLDVLGREAERLFGGAVT